MKKRIKLSIIFLSLAIGVSVYLFDRPFGETYFLTKFNINLGWGKSSPIVFSQIGQNLPSMIHTLIFILLTSFFIHSNSLNNFFICLFWFLLNFFFEIGQKYGSIMYKMIPEWFQKIPFLENTGLFFKNGTFDYRDLIGILVGSIFAFFIMSIQNSRSEHENKIL